MRNLFFSFFLAVFVSISFGDYLISSWEDTGGDGWIDWGSQAGIETGAPNATSTYTFLETIGVTEGSYSLGVHQSGWGQSLMLELNSAQKAQLLLHDMIEFDFSVAAGTTGGWCEIYRFELDIGTWTWTSPNTPMPGGHFDFWPGSPQRTSHVGISYDIDTLPSHAYLRFHLNTDGTQKDFYFDNMRMTPEPTTIALLGLGGLLLRRRKY